MTASVVYESMYGNTRAIAEAIAEGLGDARAIAVHEADSRPGDELLVVGGPTHLHGLSMAKSREAAIEAAREDGGEVEPGAAEEPGLRAWLRDLPEGRGSAVAAFDTRADKAPWLTGAASRGIAKRLRRRGYEVVGTASFLVEHSEGPLAANELDRARRWADELARKVAVSAGAERAQ